VASSASLAEVWSAAAAAVQHTASSPTPTHRHTAALARPPSFARIFEFPFSPGILLFHSRENGNEKFPGIPGARETGAREWKPYNQPQKRGAILSY